MINTFSVQCRFISDPWIDRDGDTWIRVSCSHEEPDYVDVQTSQNRYLEEIFDVLIAKHRLDYLYQKCYKGQMVHLTGMIKGYQNRSIIFVDQIYCITDKNRGFNK